MSVLVCVRRAITNAPVDHVMRALPGLVCACSASPGPVRYVHNRPGDDGGIQPYRFPCIITHHTPSLVWSKAMNKATAIVHRLFPSRDMAADEPIGVVKWNIRGRLHTASLSKRNSTFVLSSSRDSRSARLASPYRLRICARKSSYTGSGSCYGQGVAGSRKPTSEQQTDLSPPINSQSRVVTPSSPTCTAWSLIANFTTGSRPEYLQTGGDLAGPISVSFCALFSNRFRSCRCFP
ncbi:hypothetical protein LY76DRAFT_215808 [Colletotrichum caudatum]|nr:hypothetical protein LY76DRAFT_215808 [Colletotrichum caudatum]